MQKTKRNFFTLTAKAVVVNEKNEVLLARRSKKEAAGSGKYDLPGGKLEAGENILDGLRREIREETGLEVEIGPTLYTFDFGEKYDQEIEIGQEKLLVSGKGLRFLAFYKSGEAVSSNEHGEWEWVALEKASDKFGETDFEADKKLAIKKAREYMENQRALSNWTRAVAEFENYKKRQAEERKEWAAFSNLNLIMEILPVLDNFHASTDHIPADQKENSWVIGIMHIQKQMEKILEDNGVKEIEIKAGEKFNPETMEALENKECRPEDCKNIVKKIVMKGYKMGERVVRAAKVVVE